MRYSERVTLSYQEHECLIKQAGRLCACVHAALCGGCLCAQGECAERCADAHGFSREAQEDAALEGFRRAAAAAESGVTAQVRIAVVEVLRCSLR